MKRQQLAKRLDQLEQALNEIEKTTLRPPSRSTHTIKFTAPPDEKTTYEVQYSEIPRGKTNGVQRFSSQTKINIIIQPAKSDNPSSKSHADKKILNEEKGTAQKSAKKQVIDSQEKEKPQNEQNIMITPPRKEYERQFQYPFNSSLIDISVSPPYPVNRLNKDYPYLEENKQKRPSGQKNHKNPHFEPFKDLQRLSDKKKIGSSSINPYNPQNGSNRVETQYTPKDKNISSRNLSSKAIQIVQRLSHKTKPCNHNDNILMQADQDIFHDIIRSSTFFTKYFSDRKFVSQDEQKRLFNGLRNSGMPYCEWNNAIKDFIYRKMQHLPTKSNLPKYKLKL